MISDAEPAAASSGAMPGEDAALIMQGQAVVVDAVLAASRVFVAVASNALVGTRPQVTLPQFRALVLLEQHGELSVARLAAELDVVPSTASRMCERLVNKKLVSRRQDRSNRRQVTLRLLPAGHTLIAESTRRRKREIARLLRSIAPADQEQLAAALGLLVAAAS